MRFWKKSKVPGFTPPPSYQLVRKKKLGRDPDAQALEDALCLVFLETQLEGVADQLDEDHTVDVLRKSMKKMSPGAIALAGELPLHARGRALLERAATTEDRQEQE